MMEIIAHRQNRISDLKGLDPAYGVEIDIRSKGEELLLAHDPFNDGDLLRHYLEAYAKTHRDRLLILNTKEDGLEAACLALLKRFDIPRFFFLDTALPTLVKWVTKEKEPRFAVRVSEYEPPVLTEPFEQKAEWVWLDCFMGKATALDVVQNLKRSFKMCAVSPELQGYPADRIDYFLSLKPHLDAVCTKYPERWR